jgi:chromosomal replication initiator protein
MPRIKILIIESDDAATALKAVQEALFPATASRMPPTMQAIIDATCQQFQVDKAMVLSNVRRASLTTARKVIYHLTRLYTELSVAEIGEYLRRDHSSVVHGASSLNRQLHTDRVLDAHVEAIIKTLRQKGVIS